MNLLPNRVLCVAPLFVAKIIAMSATPEIIAPAGDLEKLKVALAFGADAVYCGLPSFSLRARENEFTFEDLLEARRLTREKGVKMYLTCNIFPRGPQLLPLTEFAKKIPEIAPDGIIFADPGVFAILRKHNPDAKFHLSVQANNVNAASVQFWYEAGVRRVIVARELSLREIAAIHAACPAMELEAFVHGSICFTYSGRCLISNYLTYRDGNRGTCANSCRWRWKVFEVQEEKRPDENFRLEEDEHGSYLFNSKDLCLIDKIGQLRAAGVTGFKIEGRHKSVGYLGTIVRAYKKALTDDLAGRPFDESLWREVFSVGHRGYTTGFFDGTLKDLQNYARGDTENPQTFLGVVTKSDPQGWRVEIAVRNRFENTARLEIVMPGEIISTTAASLQNAAGERLAVAHGGAAEPVFLTLPVAVPALSLVRLAA